MIRARPPLASSIEKVCGYFPSDSSLWIFSAIVDLVFRQEIGMDMSEPNTLFDDIALSGRFADVLDGLPLVPISFQEGALFDDIHALARFPQTCDIVEGRPVAPLSSECVISAAEELGAGQAAVETKRPYLRNTWLQVGRPLTNGRPLLPRVRPVSLTQKLERAWGRVVRPREPCSRGLHASCRGPPSNRQGPNC